MARLLTFCWTRKPWPARVIVYVALCTLLPFVTLTDVAASKGRQQDGRPAAGSPKPDGNGSAVSGKRIGAPGRPGILIDPGDDYRIGPRDVLAIKVDNADELSGDFSVSSAGSISMPRFGRVLVKGKTADELAQFIADGLRGNYLKNPRVSVSVKEYNSRIFYILGSVQTPGPYLIENRASLLKLIVLAGGMSEKHGETAFILRPVKAAAPGPANPASADTPGSASPVQDAAQEEEDEYEIVTANIYGLTRGDIRQNINIEPGDIINIPPADVFFVGGEVVAPGEFPLKPGTTLRQAISLAQGMKFNAAKDRGVIFRIKKDTGERYEVKVDIGAVMDGKKPDVPLQANDIVAVPNSRAKAIGGALLNAFGMGVVQRGVPVRY